MKTHTLNRLDIYATLKHDIAYLKMLPGSPIVEADLIAQLGVSRTPIRAAGFSTVKITVLWKFVLVF